MYYLEILFIAISLSMDSFAVAIAGSLSARRLTWPQILRAAFVFGFFHSLFAALGWLLSQSFKELVERFDHWVAFVLLLSIGSKMIWESVKVHPEKRSFNIERFAVLLVLSVAISIDSLVVGMGLGFLERPVLLPVIIIGIVTILVSFVGFVLGIKNGFRFLGNKAEFVGGLLLIIIGIRIFAQHIS